MTTTSSPGSPPRAPSGASDAASRWSKRWLLIAVGVAGVALAYGVGRFQGALALTGVEQQKAIDHGTWQASLAACEADRDLLAARRSLSLVALSLDRRNFGVAENHRQDALQAFERPSLRGVAAVTELASTVRALNLAVDPDPGAKREQVVAVSEALDRLVVAAAGQAPVPAASAAKTP